MTIYELGYWRYTCELACIKGAAQNHPLLGLPALACLSRVDLQVMSRVAHELALAEDKQRKVQAARRSVREWQARPVRCWGDLLGYSEAIGRYERAQDDVAGAEVAPHVSCAVDGSEA